VAQHAVFAPVLLLPPLPLLLQVAELLLLLTLHLPR
jgi:hypothetical protein